MARHQMVASLDQWISVTIDFQNLVEIAQANREFLVSAD